jgi:hypothetical protein
MTTAGVTGGKKRNIQNYDLYEQRGEGKGQGPEAKDGSKRTLLPELGLTLLDGGHHHVAGGGGGQPVEAGTDALDGDDVKVLGTGVVGAVHHGADGQTEGNPELSTSGSTRSYTLRKKDRSANVLTFTISFGSISLGGWSPATEKTTMHSQGGQGGEMYLS